MSIYGKDSYSESKIGFLGGPIEHWWDTDEEPNRFQSLLARQYRSWRMHLHGAFRKSGFLIYKPHEAFGGNWNEKAQHVNDSAIDIADFFVDMTPLGHGIVALGTAHERRYAIARGKPIFQPDFPDTDADPYSREWQKIAYERARNFVAGVDTHLNRG